MSNIANYYYPIPIDEHVHVCRRIGQHVHWERRHRTARFGEFGRLRYKIERVQQRLQPIERRFRGRSMARTRGHETQHFDLRAQPLRVRRNLSELDPDGLQTRTPGVGGGGGEAYRNKGAPEKPEKKIITDQPWAINHIDLSVLYTSQRSVFFLDP